MRLSVITPERSLLEDVQAEEVFAPGVEGQLDVFPEHANFLTELETGVLKWKSNGKYEGCVVSYGWMEIQGETITVLADVAELPHEIDEDRAKEAENQAKYKLEKGGLDQSDFRKMELKLKRALARQDASGL